MNILFLDSIETGVYGGMEEWIRLVAVSLADRGHAVVVLGRPKSAFLERLRSHSESITLIETNLSGDFNPLTIASIRNIIREHRIDLVSVNFNRDVRLGGFAAKLGGEVRVVWSVGLNITGEGFAHKHLTPRLIDGVIVPSAALKNQITALGYIAPDIVKVIPIGIGALEPTVNRTGSRKRVGDAFGIGESDIVCVTSGRFVEQKGHRYLIEAAVTIVEAHPGVRFLWFGDGPLEAPLKSQIEGSGLSTHFILAGMRDNVDEFLAGCDLMVHPSIEEPFGIAILEGMRAGLPVVASRVGGIPEVVAEDRTARLVPHADPKALASAVSGMVSDAGARIEFGKAGQFRWRESFRLESMIDSIERYFSEIC